MKMAVRTLVRVCAVLMMLLPALASGATIYWDGTGTSWNLVGPWSTASNATVPDPAAKPGAADIATFNISTVNTAQTVNLDAAQAAAGLVFNSTGTVLIQTGAGTNTLTLGASGITINGGAGADTISAQLSLSAAQLWTNNSANLFTVSNTITTGANQLTIGGTGDTTVSGLISGTGGLVKTGTGTLNLVTPSTNNFGTLTVNDGLVAMNANGRAISGDLVIGDGVGLASSAVVRLDQSSEFNAAGNTNVTINNDGLLNLNGFIDFITNLTMTGGSITTGTGKLFVKGNVTTNSNAASTASISGNLDLSGGTVTFTTASGGPGGIDLSISAAIGNGAITKAGNGNLLLSASSSFSGGLTLNSGTLLLGNDSAAGTGTLTLNSGTIQASGGARNIANTVNATGDFTVGGITDLTFSGPVTLSASRIITVSNTGNTTFSNAIGGVAVGLTKAGAGTLIFGGSAANTYTGTTTVNAGTLLLGKTGLATAIPGDLVIGDGIGGASADVVRLQAFSQFAAPLGFATSNVTINSSGLLDMGSNQDGINNLTLTGGAITVGVNGFLYVNGLTSNSNPCTATISGGGLFGILSNSVATFTIASGPPAIDVDISATVAVPANSTLVKAGGGILRLSSATNAFQFFGNLSLNAGTLAVGNNAALGTGNLILNGGFIRADGAPRTLANNVALNADSAIEGVLDLTFNGTFTVTGNRTLTVDNVVGNTTIAALSLTNGNSLTKSGPGTLTLASSPAYDGALIVSNGTLSGDMRTIGPNGSLTLNGGAYSGNFTNQGAFTQNAGTFSGNLTNQGAFTYNAGTFSGHIVQLGNFALNADLTVGNGMENDGLVTVNAGRTLNFNGTGLDNESTITLIGGTIGGTGQLVNNASISGFGTIAGSGGFRNNASLTQSGGNLTLSNTAGSSNFGNIDLAPGLQFRIVSGLANSGAINLNNATITGLGTLFNDGGGTITGRGTIACNFSNQGGSILVSSGTINFTLPFSNFSTIQLDGFTASISGAALTNSGTLQGNGTVGIPTTNNATIEAIGGTLTIATTLTNSASGTLRVSSGNKLLAAFGLPTNAGIISLTGGTFDNGGQTLNNTGQITGYGTFATGGLTNNGSFTLTGGTSTINGDVTNALGKTINIKYNPAIFTGNITNNGAIKTTNTTVTFTGTYAGNAYTSDPSTNIFQNDVTINGGGSMTGGPGDIYIFMTGNFTNIGNFTNGGTLQSSDPSINTGNFTQSGPQTWASGTTFTNNAGTATFASDTGSPAASTLSVVVNAGTVNFSATQHLAALTINASQANFTPNNSLTGRTSRVGALTIAGGPGAWTGKLDLTNNNLIVGSVTNITSFANVQSQIIQAAGTPAPANPWNGAGGITSSSAATASAGATKTALGYATGAEYTALTGLTLFDSLTFNTTDTLIKYTLVGDANLDGTVNINDFFALSGHINQNGDWSQGDFNYTGNVNINDFFAMTGNFNKTLAVGNLLPAATAAPEPAALPLLLAGMALLLARRRPHAVQLTVSRSPAAAEPRPRRYSSECSTPPACGTAS